MQSLSLIFSAGTAVISSFSSAVRLLRDDWNDPWGNRTRRLVDHADRSQVGRHWELPCPIEANDAAAFLQRQCSRLKQLDYPQTGDPIVDRHNAVGEAVHEILDLSSQGLGLLDFRAPHITGTVTN